MTAPKRFTKGKHGYTRYGSNFKEVHVPGKPPEEAPPEPMAFDIDPQTDLAVYANLTIAHQNEDEMVLDFCFRPPNQKRARVRARVAISHRHAEELKSLLERALAKKKRS